MLAFLNKILKPDCAQCGQPAPAFQQLCKTCNQAAAAARRQEQERRRQAAEAQRQAARAAEMQAKKAAAQAAADTAQAAKGAITLDQLQEKLDAASQNGLTPEAALEARVSGMNRALESAFEDHLLSDEEENALRAYIDRFAPHGLAKEQAIERLNQGQILRVVCEGGVPENIEFVGRVPFNLQKSEKLVYVFNDVQYYERMTRTRRTGTSHGVSIRLAKGLYYSPRQFQSQTEEWQETVHRDTGLLGLTTKHIYFRGPEKAFRRPYSKIVSIDYEYDGISYVPDLANAKPQIFRIGDTWFPYNLAVNLAEQAQ